MAWAAALGGIFGNASEGMASAAQYQASKHERNIAWKRQQAWELMAPSLRVAGLRQAGLNPILAAGGNFAAGPGHVDTARPGGMPSFDKDVVGRAISSAKQAKLMEPALREANARADLAEWQAKAGRYLPERAYHEAGAAAEQWSRLSQEVLNLSAQRGLTGAHQAQSESLREKMDVERLLMQLGIPGARAMEELYQRHPWLRQMREFSGGSLGSTAIGAGTAAAGYLFGRGRRVRRGEGVHDLDTGEVRYERHRRGRR